MKKIAVIILLLVGASFGQTVFGNTQPGQTTVGTPGSASQTTWYGPPAAVYNPALNDAYCNLSGQWTGGMSDGPASLPTDCNNTSLAATPSGTSTLCGISSQGICWIGNPGDFIQDPTDPRYGTGTTAVDYTSVQAAITASAGHCGVIYKIIPHTYTENVVWPFGTNCDNAHWNILESSKMSSLPPYGTRISPGYAGYASSMPARPAYNNPAIAGTYMPKIMGNSTNVSTLQFDFSTAYWRLDGLEVTSASGVKIVNYLIGRPSATSGTGIVSAGGVNQSVLTGIAAPPFNTNWPNTIQALIDNYTFTVASVASGTSLTVTPTASTLPLTTGVNVSSTGSVVSYTPNVGTFANPATNLPLNSFIVAVGCSNAAFNGIVGQITSTGSTLVQTTGTQVGTAVVDGSCSIGPWGTYSIAPGPSHIVMDHLLVHGGNDPNFQNYVAAVQRGIDLDGDHMSVVDSYLDDFLCQGGSGALACSESKALEWRVGAKTIKVVNDFLASGSENVLTGGGPEIGATSDNEIRRNHMFHALYQNKYCVAPLPAFCQGVTYINGGSPPNIKNSFEFKQCQRCLLEANVFDTVWQGQADQFGELLHLQSIGDPADSFIGPTSVNNITVRYNLLIHGNKCIDMGSESATGPIGILGLFSIHDNLCDDMNATRWGLAGTPPGTVQLGGHFLVMTSAYGFPYEPQGVLATHNTSIQSIAGGTVSANPRVVSFDITSNSNNINGVGGNAVSGTITVSPMAPGSSCGYTGAPVPQTCAFSTSTFQSNALWQGEQIQINGTYYTIFAVLTPNLLTIYENTGSQTGVPFSVRCTQNCVHSTPLPGDLWPSFTFSNNISTGGLYNNTSTGMDVFPSSGTNAFCFGPNIIATQISAHAISATTIPTSYPVGVTCPNTLISGVPNADSPDHNMTGMGFTAFTDGSWTLLSPGGTNDYTLTTGSIGHNAGNDGKDLGANMTQLSSYLSGVQ